MVQGGGKVFNEGVEKQTGGLVCLFGLGEEEKKDRRGGEKGEKDLK